MGSGCRTRTATGTVRVFDPYGFFSLNILHAASRGSLERAGMISDGGSTLSMPEQCKVVPTFKE